MLKRIKRITSHIGHHRFLSECDGTAGIAAIIGTIPRQTDIPSPYAYSPEWCVYRHNGRAIVIRETAHRRYDVFEVPAAMIQPAPAEAS